VPKILEWVLCQGRRRRGAATPVKKIWRGVWGKAPPLPKLSVEIL